MISTVTDPERPPLPLTLDATPDGALVVLDAHGRPVYAGPDVEELLARVSDLGTAAA